MKKVIHLNMLNFKTGDEALKSSTVLDKKSFWEIYLYALAIKNKVNLSERTKGFFIEILASPSGVNFFSGKEREDIAKKLDLHNTQFTHFSKELIGCGYMEKISRGVVMPKNSFVAIQKMLEKGKLHINLFFPITVSHDD